MKNNEVLAPTEVRLDKDFDADIEILLSLVPNKMAFKIGEVADLLGLKNHVLRYWESEFSGLKPKKSSRNQRMYTLKEIEILLVIRKFLYVDRFSISGARKALRQWQKNSDKGALAKERFKLQSLYNELQDLYMDLKSLSIS